MSRLEHEFAPNPGVPLPVVTKDTIDSYVAVLEESKGKSSEHFWDELAIIGDQNPPLRDWVIQCLKFAGSDMRFAAQISFGVQSVHYLLRMQAEINEESELFLPFLPVVLDDAIDKLPPSQVFAEEFIERMQQEMGKDEQHMLRKFLKGITHPLAKAAACAVYWLLKYHSKPRDEKKS